MTDVTKATDTQLADEQPTDASPSDEPVEATASVEDGAAEPEPISQDDPTADDEAEPDWELLAADDIRSRGELLAELTEAEARRDEYLDDLQRARAEFANFRKRTLNEAAQQRTHGQADVVGRLLEVLDDFDRTMNALDGADDGLVTGVGLVRDKLTKTLADLGLERIDQAGVAFDPNLHEAVQRRSAEEPTGEPAVAEIFRTGYRMGDRVLRPAMVVVEQ